MIEVTNLTKKYGDHVAVDNLSFRVEKGHIYGFLGPNGAGKSTTMNIITGYLAATEGTVTINGKDIQKEPEEAKKCVGYLPEIPPLYEDMTVEEYLKFAAQIKRVPKTEQPKQVEEVMQMTQITDKRAQLIKHQSKGYRQRVGLAQAILGYPEVIILDEPTVGLDPEQIAEFNSLIRRLGEQHAIILSSHVLSEVSAVCDQIMIIAHGRLLASDTTEALQNGSAELELLVKEEGDQAETLIGALPDVESVENKGVDQDGLKKLTVMPRDNAEIRENIFYTLAENKIALMGMVRSGKTLEDTFLELIGDAKASEPEMKKMFSSRRKQKESVTTEKEAK
ncbi:MAG: ABC transporter ATP-binding protein [Candidatus Gastranaerophilales bacterium]|nr:ABC transporter ATP-binding protein [Candidatus Gastranaerophilales bacterium]